MVVVRDSEAVQVQDIEEDYYFGRPHDVTRPVSTGRSSSARFVCVHSEFVVWPKPSLINPLRT